MPHSARSVSSKGVSSNVSIVIGCGELVASGVYPMYGDVCVCELTRLGGFTRLSLKSVAQVELRTVERYPPWYKLRFARKRVKKRKRKKGE